MTDQFGQGIAPADARPHKRWSRWAKVLAYLILLAVASFSIWFIDQDAMHEQNQQMVSP